MKNENLTGTYNLNMAAAGKIQTLNEVVNWIDKIYKDAKENPGRAWWGGSKNAEKGMAGIKKACERNLWFLLRQSLLTKEVTLQDLFKLGILLNDFDSASCLARRGRTKTVDFSESLKESKKVCYSELSRIQARLQTLEKYGCDPKIINLQKHFRGYLARKQNLSQKSANVEVQKIENTVLESIDNSSNISEEKKEKIKDKAIEIISKN